MSVLMPKYEDGKPAGTVELYKGAVIESREMNGYDDSDFYVLAWDEESEKLVRYEYATTRYGGGGTAQVDATPEAVQKANAWAYEKLKRQMFNEYKGELTVAEKGDIVKIAKGKTGKGLTGKLFWIGEKKTYGGYSRWSQNVVQKVGVALDDEKNEKGQYKNVVWTYYGNLEVDVAASKKFSISEVKRMLRVLKKHGVGAWAARGSPYFYVH